MLTFARIGERSMETIRVGLEVRVHRFHTSKEQEKQNSERLFVFNASVEKNNILIPSTSHFCEAWLEEIAEHDRSYDTAKDEENHCIMYGEVYLRNLLV